MNVGIFLTSAMEIDQSYIHQTATLAERLAKKGHGVVFGGTAYGLMKVLADSYKEHNGKMLIGVFAKDLMSVTKNYLKSDKLDVEYTEETVSARKQRMMDLSDAYVVFPGGYGTMEEITAIVGGKVNKLYDKPIAAYNINHFYAHLEEQMRHAYREKFSKISPDEILIFSDDLNQIFSYIEQYQKKELRDKFV
jgi:uncharacterized protein (TIGR00730 family)